MRGTTAAVAGRALNIPSATIRQWVKRGRLHRFPDNSIDPGCLAVRIHAGQLTTEELDTMHAERCHRGGPKP